MINFESDLSTPANTTDIPTGTPDMLDEWYADHTDEPTDQDWADHEEAMWNDEDGLTDAEADAMTLASAGYGTDEDYGYFGDDLMDLEPPF